MRKILVTGSRGFVGKNLIAELKNRGIGTIFECDLDTDLKKLNQYCRECDFIYHLAGVNRPLDEKEYMKGNFGFTSELLGILKKAGNTCPIMLSSSIQAECGNLYGKSKLAGETLVSAYGTGTGVPIYIYRFSNLFGKWCRPNYNSVVATFCHQISRSEPIQINHPSAPLNLIYIDDVVNELISLLNRSGNQNGGNYCEVSESHSTTVGELAEILYSFKESRNSLQIPDMTEGSLTKQLYSTYLSYLPQDGFKYPFQMHLDSRGSFTELIKTKDRGQMSVNISKPGVEKGNHWHHTKNEKFVVVSGRALVQFRKLGEETIIDYHASGEKLEAIDIPVGYTHNIINEGDTDLITLMWCNECFEPKKPDTYNLLVNGDYEKS